jgi:hypothetical protein
MSFMPLPASVKTLPTSYPPFCAFSTGCMSWPRYFSRVVYSAESNCLIGPLEVFCSS